jgi:hypothetical protein
MVIATAALVLVATLAVALKVFFVPVVVAVT